MIMCASARGQAKGSAEGSLARVKRQKWPPVAPGQAAGTGGRKGIVSHRCFAKRFGIGFQRFVSTLKPSSFLAFCTAYSPSKVPNKRGVRVECTRFSESLSRDQFTLQLYRPFLLCERGKLQLKLPQLLLALSTSPDH